MQCKDIPDLPILQFLSEHGIDGPGTWCNWYGIENSVSDAMPDGIPPNLILAKMRNLIKRDLVNGCGCGCRGDFELTEKGRAMLASKS